MEKESRRAPELNRLDALCAALLFIAGTCICMQTFASGEWGARPITGDEYVYLFQAKTLAAGRMTYPSPPLPEFFEVAHTLVVPKFTAKYLPGHALVLAPFVAAGVPWLAPCLLLGVTAALIFLGARLAELSRVAAASAALLLLGATNVFPFFGSYLSQSTAMAVTAAMFVCALMVRRHKSPVWIVALFSCVVFAFFVRQFTSVAAGVAAIFTLVRWRRGLFLWAIPPLVTGAIGGVIVCYATTGSAITAPWSLYARQYMPYDGPGIGAITEVRPERGMPAHLHDVYDEFLDSRRKHTWSRLPSEALRRVGVVAALAPSWAVIPFAVGGLFWSPLALTSIFAIVLFLLQLTFHVGGAIYHLEMYPWLALAAAAGGEMAFRKALTLQRNLTISACALLAIPILWTAAVMTRETANVLIHAPQRGWRYAPWEPTFAKLRDLHALVFIHYPDNWSGDTDLTWNDPDLEHADLVRAIDLGARDTELLPYFSNRPAFVLDAATGGIKQIR